MKGGFHRGDNGAGTQRSLGMRVLGEGAPGRGRGEGKGAEVGACPQWERNSREARGAAGWVRGGG